MTGEALYFLFAIFEIDRKSQCDIAYEHRRISDFYYFRRRDTKAGNTTESAVGIRKEKSTSNTSLF